MPEGWAWCRLGTLSETTDYIANGSFADTRANVKFYKEKNYALLVKTQDFNNNFTDDLTYTDETGYNFLCKSHLFGGELLLSNIGASIGKALIVPKFDIPMAVAPNSIVVRTTDLLETQFLKSIMLSTYGQNALVAFTAGSAMPKFNKTQLRSLLIPLPTIYAQQSIISTVNTIFETIQVIENDKDELENLIKHTKSKILDLAIHGKLVPQDPNDEPAEELLKRIATSDNRPYKKFDDDIPFSLPKNWEWCYLGDICRISSAKRVLQQDWKDSGIPFYRAREIAQLSNNEKVKDDLFITPELYRELKNKYGVPISGDLMISAVGTIGKVYIVKETDCFYYKDASVICFSKKEKSIDSKYLKLCLESGFLQNQIYSQSTGTTVDTITINKAQEYLFPLPNITEQQRIVTKIEELFSYLDTISSNLE